MKLSHVIWFIAAWFFALMAGEAKAEGWRLLDLETFNMEYYRLDAYRDDYASYALDTNESWKDGAATNFNLTLLAYDQYRIYMDNRVHMEDTNSQVRHVGWEWETGVDLKLIDIFWHHHSQHVLDATVPGERYPLENYYGVRVNFYERSK